MTLRGTVIDPQSADPLVDVVFDARTGYHVVTKPAGHFENHPLGEGDAAVFTIIRCKRSQLPELWKWSESEEVVEHVADNVWRVRHPRTGEGPLVEAETAPTPMLEVEHLPVAKLDLAAHRAVRQRAAGSKLQNVYTIDSLRVAPGSVDDFLTETARFETRRNAILTVGTGKTHATISAAITASSSGDCIEVYAGGAANVYTETISFGKILEVLGMVANQGITITKSSGNVVAGYQASLLQNFKIEATGTAAYTFASGAHSYMIRDVVASGGTVATFDLGYYGRCYNCAAISGVVGWRGGSYRRYTCIHCIAVNYSNIGFDAYPYHETFIACLAANNGTDFDNLNANHAVCCVSEDESAIGAAAVTGFDPNDLEDTWKLKSSVKETTKARYLGQPFVALDALGQPRKTAGVFFAGAHDPDPDVPDYPEVENVDETDTVDGVTGTNHRAPTTKVELAYAYGPASAWTGAYSLTAATTPSFVSVTFDSDTGQVTVEVAGGAGETIAVGYASTDGRKQGSIGSRTGPGSIGPTSVPRGYGYMLYATSTTSGGARSALVWKELN